MMSLSARFESCLTVLTLLALAILTIVNWHSGGRPGWWVLLVPIAAWIVLGQLSIRLGLRAVD